MIAFGFDKGLPLNNFMLFSSLINSEQNEGNAFWRSPRHSTSLLRKFGVNHATPILSVNRDLRAISGEHRVGGVIFDVVANIDRIGRIGIGVKGGRVAAQIGE